MQEASTPVKTLWMLECDNGYSLELIPLYAVSEQEAEQRAEDYLRKSSRHLSRRSLRHFPNGFTIHRTSLPGRLPEKA